MSWAQNSFRYGVDRFIESDYKNFLGKRIGLITNATGITSELESTVDALFKLKAVKLSKLFGPEHGLRGDAHAGQKVEDQTDEQTGLPVFSLYGKTHKPTDKMLEGLDMLVYDIQDIGNRGYTYIYTMAQAMQAASENQLEFVVLDRPIALYGNMVDGNILDTKFSSFVGMFPIPYIYGMTPGELAQLFNQEFGIHCKLTVIPMEGYNHEMDFGNTGRVWIPPSPHIPRYESAYYCGATGILGELKTVCEGVGYTQPFEYVGAPWINSGELARELTQRHIPGVYWRPAGFRPFYGKFKDQDCQGVQLIITDKTKFYPFQIQLHIFDAIQKLYPNQNFLEIPKDALKKSLFIKVIGSDQIHTWIIEQKGVDQIIQSYQAQLDQFKETRKKYLLYP